MSKRPCTSLIYAPQRSRSLLPRCSPRSIYSILRDDPRRTQCAARRPFTSSSTWRINAGRQVTIRKQNQPSMSVARKRQQEEAMRDGTVLEMQGLLPENFVPPTGANLPSFFTDFKKRLKIEKYRFQMNVIRQLQFQFMAWWYIKPRLKSGKHVLPLLSQELYRLMYTRFARGNLQDVEYILSPGLLGSLRARIAQRPPNTSMRWTLHELLETPKVVSFVGTIMPGFPNHDQFGIIQAVVRIRSRQSLLKTQKMRIRNRLTGARETEEVVVDSEGHPIPEEEIEAAKLRSAKDTTEYLVVQRLVKHSKPEHWHIWGTAEESTYEKLVRQEKEIQRMRVAGTGA